MSQGTLTKRKDRVKKIYHKGKEVLIVDYTDLKGQAMIEIFEEAKDLFLSENKHYVALSLFSDKSYVSPSFIRHIEQELIKVEMLLDKQAVVGISTVQKWILKGLNLWVKSKLQSFNSYEEGINYLTDD